MKSLLAATAALALAPAHAQDYQASDDAREIARETIILDGHVDIPYRVWASGEDVGEEALAGDFDYPRAMEGGLNAPFMSIYVAADYQETGGAKAQADRLIGLVEGLAAMHPDKFEIAKSVRDVRRITEEGKIALPLGMENGAPIEGDLDNLEHFYDRGIRYVTLTHSKVNHLSDSSYDEERRWGGLSPFGRLAVQKMNDLGIMVDVSHISDEAFDDVMAVTRAPVIASHSSARHFTPGFERNMSDAMIERLAENGGVIMINFGSSFIGPEWAAWRDEAQAAYREHLEAEGIEDTEEAMEAFSAEYEKTSPRPYATLDDVLDHIDHVVQLAGIDHVGIGSDYDGVGDSLPVGLKDVSDMPNLVQGLLDRGYSREDIEQILSGNALRVWREVERAGKRRR
ncbi:dipeptidase [Parvularcula oceani]|uniref:dipeptidase n=1 Tax=Parvularcula oceani TaxID=1247963 RepID=UPI0004E1D519|nr:dipeptidase [Parvularcula oceani]